jgi:hypothetical protein
MISGQGDVCCIPWQRDVAYDPNGWGEVYRYDSARLHREKCMTLGHRDRHGTACGADGTDDRGHLGIG